MQARSCTALHVHAAACACSAAVRVVLAGRALSSHTIIRILLFRRHRPNGRDGARKQRFGLAVRCALLAQQFVHGLLIDWSSALHFAEEAVDEVRRPLSCR